MPMSEDVLRLVRTVECLPSEDQDKILRMVDLLTLVPLSVQDKTQRMLRELLERQPDTKRECVAGVDDVIERDDLPPALRQQEASLEEPAFAGAAPFNAAGGESPSSTLALERASAGHPGAGARTRGIFESWIQTSRSSASV